MSISHPPFTHRFGNRTAGGRPWLRVAAFMLVALAVALVGQTSSVRDVGHARPDGVVDRAVGGDRGILPVKPSLKVFSSDARGSRPTLDLDPSIVVISIASGTPVPPAVVEPIPAVDAGVHLRQEGWTHRPRDPPMDLPTVSVESRASSSHHAVPSMMA